MTRPDVDAERDELECTVTGCEDAGEDSIVCGVSILKVFWWELVEDVKLLEEGEILLIEEETLLLEDAIQPVDADKLLQEGAMDRDDEVPHEEGVHVRNALTVLEVVLYG